MPAGEDLHDCAATDMTVALDHVAFQFLCDQEVQSGKLFTETGERHQQFK